MVKWMSKTCENCIHFCVCVYRDGTPITASCCAFYDQNKRPHGEWIPLKYRPMDEDEYRAFSKEYGYLPVEERTMFDCQMPEDGQEILISTKYGHIFLDTCVFDDCYGLEEYGDWNDVLAWMPIPKPYEKEGEKE